MAEIGTDRQATNGAQRGLGAGGRRDDAGRATRKSPTAYRTISEVSDDLEVPQHVLRFWETKFPQVRPLKRGGGRRYYRPEDITLLKRIQTLLYNEGYTIKGVQKLLREGRVAERAKAAGPQGQAGGGASDAGAADMAPPNGHEAKPEGRPGTASDPAEQDPPLPTLPLLGSEETQAPETATLATRTRRELEAVLDDLRALRAMLKGAGSSDR